MFRKRFEQVPPASLRQGLQAFIPSRNRPGKPLPQPDEFRNLTIQRLDLRRSQPGDCAARRTVSVPLGKYRAKLRQRKPRTHRAADHLHASNALAREEPVSSLAAGGLPQQTEPLIMPNSVGTHTGLPSQLP